MTMPPPDQGDPPASGPPDPPGRSDRDEPVRDRAGGSGLPGDGPGESTGASTERPADERGAGSGVRTLGGLLAWLIAAVAATLVGVVAVGAIGDGILPPPAQPLSQAEVERRLAEATAPPNGPPPTAEPTPEPTTPGPSRTPPATEVFRTPGGTVVVRCDPGVQVVSATPLQGFRVKDIEPEDGGKRVRFEAGDRDVRVMLSCVDDRPKMTYEDDHADDSDDDSDGDDSGESEDSDDHDD